MNEDYEIVAGMVATESPQRRAARLIEFLESGEIERLREMIASRALRTAEAMARELAHLEDD